MILDSSALIAVLLGEEDADYYVAALKSAREINISVVSVLESTLVMAGRKGEGGVARLERFLQTTGIRMVPLDAEQLSLAREAGWRYGKGRHAARLNLGDCCSYALAKATGEPLLYQGNDFGRTDLHCITAPRTA
jgi:ribonuclease VapC